jgi:hypothetical protein
MAGTTLVNGLPRSKAARYPTISVDMLNHARANNQILLSGSNQSWPPDAATINRVVFFLEGFHPSGGGTVTLQSIDATTVFTYTGTSPVDFHRNPMRFDGGISYTGNCEYLRGFFVEADYWALNIV